MVTDEGHKLWYSDTESKHRHGVGFIVNKDGTKSAISCTLVYSRLTTRRMSANPKNIVIQVYVPAQNYDDDAVKKVYDKLEEIIRNTPKKDLLVIAGDWNANAGPDAHNQWTGTGALD